MKEKFNMANKQVKSRILLPIGTKQQLSQRYAEKQLSAGELLIVKTAGNKFYLSAGLSTNVSGKLKVDIEDIAFTDVDSMADVINQLSATDLELSSKLSGQTEDASNIWLSSVTTSEPIQGGKLEQLNIVKFDSLDTYKICSDVLTLSDLALIDEANLNAEGERILSVADPISASDGANKRYVDGKLSGILNNSTLQTFYNTVNQNGVNNVDQQQTVSAIYELIKELRQS